MKVIFRSLCVTVTLPLLLLGVGLGNTAVANPADKCEGSELRGAWFTALNPPGMHVSASRDTVDENGALSVWLISEDGTTEFFLFSPQWGGTPYEIFLGAQSKNEVEVIAAQSFGVVQLELIYEDMVGRYTITRSSDPVTHLTVGYRTKDGTLSKEHLQKYRCFTDSIIQYSD